MSSLTSLNWTRTYRSGTSTSYRYGRCILWYMYFDPCVYSFALRLSLLIVCPSLCPGQQNQETLGQGLGYHVLGDIGQVRNCSPHWLVLSALDSLLGSSASSPSPSSLSPSPSSPSPSSSSPSPTSTQVYSQTFCRTQILAAGK